MTRRIGIFGGTFDPVHIGHLQTVAHVQQALALAEIRLIPLGVAVHRDQPFASPAQRLAMLQRAVANQPGLVVDDRELQRPGQSYTVDTLRSLAAELPGDPLYLILGSDAFAAFAEWHEPAEILRLANLVIMQRPDSPTQQLPPGIDDNRLVDSADALHQSAAGRILLLEVPPVPVSSSLIRQRIADGQNVDAFLSADVSALIRQWQLYQ